jgi:metallo-beta-lactamase class B
MIGNVFYVGTASVSCHLFASDAGHILIDTGFPKDAATILTNIGGLGFKPRDVEYILLSHAHIDHIGSAARLAREIGATMCIGERDKAAAEQGSTTLLELAGTETFRIDRVIREGDVIRLGETAIRIHETPGHTPGCCSFGFDVTEAGRTYPGFLFGGPGTAVFEPSLVKRGVYGGIREDFGRTLDKLESLPVEVWLGAHPGQNRTFEKYERLMKGEKPNPFIDPAGWQEYLRSRREAFMKSE